MYELIQLTEHDYYIDCPAKIGLIRVSDDEVVLIDSGSDKDAGKKVYRILDSNKWKLRAIFNTHSHADHIGGNHFLQEKTGCNIYAKGMECAYANTPLLEPIGLYGGLPFKELKHKFLMAQESHVLPLTSESLPAGINMFDLPGHCFEMVGFKTSDGTAYIADSVSSAETLEKYGIGYLWNPDVALKTLSSLQALRAERFVPSHAPVMENIQGIIELNIKAISEVKRKILEICSAPITFEMLLKQIFEVYHLQMTAQQYALIGSTLRSYLSSMYEEKSLVFCFDDNQMLWQANSHSSKD